MRSLRRVGAAAQAETVTYSPDANLKADGDAERQDRRGSVVTKDPPSNVVAVGNPCRVLREVNGHDGEYYFKDKRIGDHTG